MATADNARAAANSISNMIGSAPQELSQLLEPTKDLDERRGCRHGFAQARLHPAAIEGHQVAQSVIAPFRNLIDDVGGRPAEDLFFQQCVIEAYLGSRAIRFPGTAKRNTDAAGSPLSHWPARAPLFVGRDGERITRGILQSRVKRAFKHAGPDAQPLPGALVHGLRHTYATELAGSDVSVYTLMKLLGHESMTTSQRYVSAAGTETRSAAARNPIY